MMNNCGNWQFINNSKLVPNSANKMMNPNMIKPGGNMMSPCMGDMMKPGMDGMMKPDIDDMMKPQYKPGLPEALELIKQAVEGETEDRLFYDYLIKNAPSEEDKQIISGIRDNEITHAKLFRQLYYELTGKTIPPNTDVNFEPPKTYCEGLIKALIGETNAVKKYRNILFVMTERRHINMLTEIITDEIRHGILYNLLVHNNDCKY